MTDDSAPAKRMARDWFFPTPVYHTDLAQAKGLNARLAADIRAWRERDPGGTFRSNVPQLGGWHSATDMHLRAGVHGADSGDLRTDPRRVRRPGLRRCLRAGLRLDVGERQPARRVQPPPHPSARAVERGLLRPHPGRLRTALSDRSASPGARDHPVLRRETPLRPYLGRGFPTTSRWPAGSSPFQDGSSIPRTPTWRARGLE